MKLLHVSDLHFRTHWFEWVAAQSRHYDAVCLSGDLLDMFRTTKASLRVQAKWVRDWLREFPGRLFVCSGNHDWRDCEGVVDTDAHCGWLNMMARPEVRILVDMQLLPALRPRAEKAACSIPHGLTREAPAGAIQGSFRLGFDTVPDYLFSH